MNNELNTIKQEATRKIIDILSLHESADYDHQAATIIISAVENYLGCRQMADGIVDTLRSSPDINQNMFLIIQDLMVDTYFHPTPEISGLIETYFEQVGDKFNSPEDFELYEELASDLDKPDQSGEILL